MGKSVKVIHTGITDPKEIINILKREGFKRIFDWYDPPQTFYDWHSHSDYELRWIYKGKLEVGTDEGVFILEEGDRLEIEAGVRHWARTETGVYYIGASK
jgi:mannose-6-phosphate isomerase-like protein (cupin superfamily)